MASELTDEEFLIRDESGDGCPKCKSPLLRRAGPLVVCLACGEIHNGVLDRDGSAPRERQTAEESGG